METKMIGIKITEARKKINISQAQLAEKLFISAQAVGKWERGESLPDIITLNLLAGILGVDLNYFSEKFKSVSNENSSVDSQAKPSSEPNPDSGKKLSWDMSRGNWVGADFSGLKNLHEKFSSSNMQRCKFIGSELSGLLLKGNNINGCDFSGSDISISRIQSSNLTGNQFKNCSLKETEFLESFITGCDFSGTMTNYTPNDFIKYVKIDRNLAKHFTELSEKRHKGDYNDFYDYDKETVIRLYPVSQKFIDVKEQILKN